MDDINVLERTIIPNLYIILVQNWHATDMCSRNKRFLARLQKIR